MNQIILNTTLTTHRAQTFVRDELLAALATPISEATRLACKHLPAMILSGKKVEEITGVLSKCKSSLSERYTKIHNLMLHHLSAIMDRSDLIASLCPKKLNMPKDDQGYTPLHFRALLTMSPSLETDPYYQQFITQCLTEKSTLDTKTKFGQTPQQIFKQAISLDQMPNNQAELPTTFAFDALTSSTPSHHRDCLGNATLVNQIVATRENLFRNWLWMKPSPYANSQKLTQAYEKFLKNPPPIEIKPTSLGYCGIFPKAPIKQGELLFRYDGEMIIQHIANASASNYYFSLTTSSSHQQGIDAVQYRSVAAMANDGPPNIAAVELFNKEGLNQRLAFFALRDLQPGEELVFCYGPTQVIKNLDYKITDQKYQELVRFLSTSKYRFRDASKLMLESAKHLTSTDPSTYSFPIDKRRAFDTFQYIINTPIVSQKLIEDGHLAEQDYRALFSQQMLPFLQKIPMFLSYALNGFLWSRFKSECEKNSLMPFFFEIAEIQKSHFSRFMKPHLEYDPLGRTLQAYRFAQAVSSLLEGIEEGVAPKTLKDKFEQIYAQTDLFKDASLGKKASLVEKISIKGSELALINLQKYNLIED